MHMAGAKTQLANNFQRILGLLQSILVIWASLRTNSLRVPKEIDERRNQNGPIYLQNPKRSTTHCVFLNGKQYKVQKLVFCLKILSHKPQATGSLEIHQYGKSWKSTTVCPTSWHAHGKALRRPIVSPWPVSTLWITKKSSMMSCGVASDQSLFKLYYVTGPRRWLSQE